MGLSLLIPLLFSLLLLQDTAPPLDSVQAHKKAVEAGRLIGQGEWQQALALAKEAVEADPTSAEAHYALALAYEAAGDLEAAETEYKKMGLLAPDSLLEVSLARLYLRQGRLVEAEQQAHRAVEKNRWVPQPHLALGAVAMRKKDYPTAIAAFSKAVDVAPWDWNARLSLADSHRRAEDWDEALAQYAQALVLKPNHPEGLLGKAQTWEQMGRPAEAIAAYEKALEAAPNLLMAQYNLARLFLTVTDPLLANPQTRGRAGHGGRRGHRVEERRHLEDAGRCLRPCRQTGSGTASPRESQSPDQLLNARSRKDS